MSEVTLSASPSILARKFRKKLRQIENLERLNRPLTDEEIVKVTSKSSVRDQLRDVLERLDKEEEAAAAAASVHRNDLTEEQTSFEDNGHPSQLDRSKDSANVALEDGTPNLHSGGMQTGSQAYSSPSATAEPEAGDRARSHKIVSTPKSVGSIPSTGMSNAKAHPKVELSKTTTKGSKSAKNKDHLSKRSCRVTSLDSHNDIITSLVIVDGRVVTASRDTSLKSWDLTTGKELKTFGAHTECVTCVIALDAASGQQIDNSFSSSDSLIISSSFDCTFKMWSLDTGKLLKSVYTFNPLTKICFFHSTGQLITGSDGGKLELWNISTGENCFSSLAYQASITGLAVSDQTVYSSSAEGEIQVHQVREKGGLACVFVNDEVKTAERGTPLTPRHVRCLAWAPHRGLLYGDDSRNLKVLDWKKVCTTSPPTGCVSKFPNHSADFTSTDAVVCHDGYVLTSSYDLDEGLGYINVRHGDSLSYQASLDDHETERIMCLDFCLGPTSDLVLVTGGVDLKLWHVLPFSGSQASSKDFDDDDRLISLEFRQALSLSATDSDSESEDEDEDEGSDDDIEEGAQAMQQDGSSQGGGILSWCTVL